MSICALIMAGGSGSRLWPHSRAAYPKQFLPLIGKQTPLQTTLNRLNDLDIESSTIICNEEHRFFVAEQLREIDKLGNIILEPEGKNTAPAIALAAMTLKDDSLLLVLPADHDIKNEKAFTETVLKAVPLAEEGKLVTFGVKPTEPQTGYGYIERGKKNNAGYYVNSFKEKPSVEKAEEFFNSGEYYWNSGMFLFKTSAYLEELKNFRPDIYDICKKSITQYSQDADFLRPNKDLFTLCPDESIDYAVMEKTNKGVVIQMDADWCDIGSWASLWEVSNKDSSGNFVEGDVMVFGTNNSYIRSDEKLVAAIGLNDLIIISTKDAVLVSNKDDSQHTKLVTQELIDSDRSEWQFHREVYRPWGKYDSIDKGDRHQVKRITVKPGAKLSVQLHRHRSEHWIVVSGVARVTNDGKTFDLNANEYTYIAAETIHALENIGEEDLEIIEVQTGSYLGEDDIERISDIYGRDSNS